MQRNLPSKCACDRRATHWFGSEGECDVCEARRHSYEHYRHQDESTLSEETMLKKDFVRRANRKYQETYSFHALNLGTK